MKNTIRLLMVLFASLVLKTTAHAAYNCGAGFSAYMVASASGGSGTGVRCVKFNSNYDGQNHTGTAFAWFGEGSWGSAKYRHLGVAEYSGTQNTLIGSAADFNGNGESSAGKFDRTLRLQTIGGPIPIMIQVSGGGWSESWTYIGNNHPTYNSGFTNVPVFTCGPNFVQYRAEAPRNEFTGHGVRCMLPRGEAWYGEGQWGGRRYAHVGIGSGASDICQLGSCGTAAWGSLRFTVDRSFKTGNGYFVTGAWNERWIPYQTRYSLRVHAVKVSDNDGGRPAGITASQVSDWLDYANRVYASMGITFLFEARETGSDWSEMRNTDINNVVGEADDSTWRNTKRDGNNFASLYPDKMMVFFRFGPGMNPTGGGFSSTGYNFAVIPGFSATTICGQQNLALLAHELGHYLGLGHTFTDSFNSFQDSADFLTSKGNNRSAFDGDRLSDTFEDPGLNYSSFQCSTATTAMINGINFNIPRDNIMSYYFSNNHGISKAQEAIVLATLLFQRRGRL